MTPNTPAVGPPRSCPCASQRRTVSPSQARILAYALYQVASAPGHGWTEDALGYNNLVADWPEIQRLAAAVGSRAIQGQLEL
ncbi:MAG TPA: hypothetical protein VKY74_14095 [Chloroflexia bacterium]|nr:hypothetical protein [Chloroflexia bacterium]